MHQPMKVALPQHAAHPAKIELPMGAVPFTHHKDASVSPKRSSKLAAKLPMPKKVELPAKSILFEASNVAESFGFGDEEDELEMSPGMSFATKTRSLRVPPGLDPPTGTPSHGSLLHGQGGCRPCAWFWKPGSCQNGTNCLHCHACPEGELKARKKAKQTMMRLGLATPKLRFEATDSRAQESAYEAPLSFFPAGPMKMMVPPEPESTTCSGSEPELSFSGSEPDHTKAPQKSPNRSPRSAFKQRGGSRR